MHSLWIEPTFISHCKKCTQNITTDLSRTLGTSDTKTIAATGDLDLKTVFDLSQMLVKLAAQIGQAFIVGGLKNHVPRNQGSIQGVCL